VAHLDRVVVRRTDAFPQNHLQFSFPAVVNVSQALSVRVVANALCALPKMPPGIFDCPADFGIAYDLTFSAGGQGFATVSLKPAGCEMVHGLGPTRWIIRTPGFWRVLGKAMGLEATRNTFAGTLPSAPSLCAASAVRIVASTNFPSYGPGETVVLTSSITNRSKSACTVWLGGVSPSLVITDSKGVEVWDQCWYHDQPGACPLFLVVHQLDPGQTYTKTARWDQRSGMSGERPVRVPAGTYRFATQYTGIAGSPSVRFGVLAQPKGGFVLVYGVVRAGPTCPVEKYGHPCPPRPVRKALVEARLAQGGVVAKTRTGDSGSYSLTVPPGRYVLTVDTGSLFPRCPKLPITARASSSQRVNISCDTGIR